MRAIYGYIESDMLCYNFYVNTLKDLWFSINTYDRCVDNKMIYRKQYTIAWYVYDNKLFHIYPNVFTDILE